MIVIFKNVSEPKKISVSNGNEYNRKEIIINLDEAIKRAKEVGRYPNTDFGEMPYKPTRYEVKPSKIDTTIEETTVVETSDDELDW